MMNFFNKIGTAVLDFFSGVDYMAFVENLKYMGTGMLGIFVVIAVIIIVITVLQKFSKDDNK